MESEVSSRFRDGGCLRVRSLLPTPARTFLHDYGLKCALAGQLRTDSPQVPGTPFCYGDPLMEALLEILCPRVETETGLKLHPTYSYYRVYGTGDVLDRHIDRPACEVSVTINLGSDRHWPIWIEVDSDPVEFLLEPGDGLIYRGTQLPHWRTPFDGNNAVQVFLHYVDRAGIHGEWIFDKRKRLSTSPIARRIIGGLVASNASA
jgi:hypothetical protein